MSFLDAKPSDSKDDLLRDIISAANQRHMPGLALRPFAALMVKVADETGETVADLKAHVTKLNEENAKLQWWVVALAIAALVSAVVQTLVAVLSFTTTPALSAGDRTVQGAVATAPLAPKSSAPALTLPSMAAASPASGLASGASASATSR